jgi:hypothetical protein
MFTKSVIKHFKGFGSGFTKLHAKLDADRLLSYPLWINQNMKSKKHSSKALRVHSAVSHGRWNMLAGMCPWPPIPSSFTEAVTTITAPELSDTTLQLPSNLSI